MDQLFGRLTLTDVHRDLARNIVSIQVSQDLFDDLSDSASDWQLAQQVEDAVKPPFYRSHTPVIHRPFEDAEWFSAIDYPFRNWQASRFSDGGFGVWYGSENVETTAFETAYHWYHGLLEDAGFHTEENVVAERKVYWVKCDAALLDFRPLIGDTPALVHPSDYSMTRMVGARLHREGHPGLLTRSARCPGDNYAVLNPAVLSNPRPLCHLAYRLDGPNILVERERGVTWLSIPA